MPVIPPEIEFSHAVWHYYRFCLSGVRRCGSTLKALSEETGGIIVVLRQPVRQWCLKTSSLRSPKNSGRSTAWATCLEATTQVDSEISPDKNHSTTTESSRSRCNGKRQYLCAGRRSGRSALIDDPRAGIVTRRATVPVAATRVALVKLPLKLSKGRTTASITVTRQTEDFTVLRRR